jgi:hypothetical protein
MRRKRTSREGMRSWVARFEGSGLSAAVFCRRHGVPVERLSHWRRVVGATAPSGRRGVELAPVRVLGLVGSGGQGSVEIQLANGDRVVVREGVSPELLRETLRALREAC